MSEIVVAGAGIAGLATAAALQQRGRSVTVVEARDDTSPGASISIWPNALAALDVIGLGDAVRAAAFVASTISSQIHDITTWPTLSTYAVEDASAVARSASGRQPPGNAAHPVISPLSAAARPCVPASPAVAQLDTLLRGDQLPHRLVPPDPSGLARRHWAGHRG